MADFVYDKAKLKIANGTILPTHTFRLALMDITYSPSKTTDEYWGDISAYDISGGGYTANGVTLSGTAMTRSGAIVKFDASDYSFAALTPPFRYGVIYDDTATSDPLLCLLDFGSEQIPAGAPVDIAFNASGIFTLTDA